MTSVLHTAPLRAPPAWAANFPASTARPSSLFHFPGITPASTAMVRRLLEENNRGYDMFYAAPMRYAHNHFPHSTLARYALGAPPSLLQADWEYERGHLTALDPVDGGRAQDVPAGIPDKFTRDNWADPRWLGKKGSYSRYLPFFHEEVARLGPKGAVEEYIFSRAANAGPVNEGPTMMIALMAGVLHPLIHIGYGLEFGDPVVLAEGLAQTCLHQMDMNAKLYPKNWPYAPLPPPSGPPKPLIQLYAEFLQNPTLDPGPYDPKMLINDRLKRTLQPRTIADIQDLVARWDLSDVSDAAVQARVEELAWVTTLLTGATSRPGYAQRMDFFLMHTLTSCLFIPSYLSILSADNRRALLQSYLTTLFQVLVTRGRPHIFPKEVMSYPTYSTSGGQFAKAGKLEAVGKPGDPEDQNAWLEIVANALVFPESHVPKSIRSLLYFSMRFGHTPRGGVPGCKNPDGTEVVPGLADVDGSLFVRVANKVMETLGWVKQGAKERDWDRSALGWDGAWENEKAK